MLPVDGTGIPFVLTDSVIMALKEEALTHWNTCDVPLDSICVPLSAQLVPNFSDVALLKKSCGLHPCAHAPDLLSDAELCHLCLVSGAQHDIPGADACSRLNMRPSSE